jgi:hypothetical protein
MSVFYLFLYGFLLAFLWSLREERLALREGVNGRIRGPGYLVAGRHLTAVGVVHRRRVIRISGLAWMLLGAGILIDPRASSVLLVPLGLVASFHFLRYRVGLAEDGPDGRPLPWRELTVPASRRWLAGAAIAFAAVAVALALLIG